MRVLRNVLLRAGLPIAVVVPFYLYSTIDKAMNYKETPATVTNVKTLCHLEKQGRHLKSRTEDMPCAIAKMGKATNEQLSNYRLVRVTTVEYEYRSPADGGRYVGHYEVQNDTASERLTPGADIIVLAHSEKPGKSLHR